MRFDARVNPFELDAPELRDLIAAKERREIGSWRELTGQEYARAFTAAGTMGYDIVGDLHEAFLEVQRTPGATEEDFERLVFPILRRKGWLADKDDKEVATRLRLIYDTNLRTAQAVGRWTRIQRSKVALPYLYSFTAADERVRHPPKSPLSDHRAFEGILLPVDHPFWLNYFPPLGFRCRCQVVQKTRAQAARLGPQTTDAELAERMARLGPPWGFSPGRDPLGGVTEAANRANAKRLDGAPPLDPKLLAVAGRAAAVAARTGPREFRSPVRPDVKAETIKVRPKATVQRELSASFAEAAADPRYDPVPEFGDRYPSEFGAAKFSAAFEAKTVSMLAALKPELDDLAAQIGIPKIRGFTSIRSTSNSNANQGDGVMGLNPATFNARAARVGSDKPPATRESYEKALADIAAAKEPLLGQLDELGRRFEENRLRFPEIRSIAQRPGASELLEQQFAIQAKIEELQAKAFVLASEMRRLQPPSTWKPGDPVAQRPWSVAEYYPEGVDKARSTLFHEFGHHVHQYLNKTGRFRVVGDPPLEQALEPIFRRYMLLRKGRSPSTYSEKNSKEWFVENFSAYVMGRRDLVDPEAMELIERIFRGEFT